MLMLVTADNLVQMFFGWEGVGLASYLLIGFWYHKPSANAAAIKAFVVNRVGDLGFMLGIFGTDSNQVVEGVVQTDSVVSTLTFLLMVASSSGFYLWFWTRGGQTLGMISWRLKAVSFDDRPMSVRQGIIRFFSAWPAFWLAGIGYFWLYLDKNNDALHDKLSETKVILMPKGHKPFEKKTT